MPVGCCLGCCSCAASTKSTGRHEIMGREARDYMHTEFSLDARSAARSNVGRVVHDMHSGPCAFTPLFWPSLQHIPAVYTWYLLLHASSRWLRSLVRKHSEKAVRRAPEHTYSSRPRFVPMRRNKCPSILSMTIPFCVCIAIMFCLHLVLSAPRQVQNRPQRAELLGGAWAH